jgi:hypothetical protein
LSDGLLQDLRFSVSAAAQTARQFSTAIEALTQHAAAVQDGKGLPNAYLEAGKPE